MNNLVVMKNQQAVTSSLQVAKTFGKRHDNVMQAIGGLLKNKDTQHMFVKGSYINEQNGQKYPMCYMNRDGFTLLAVGFTGAKALDFKLQYIGQFNQMESQLQELQKDSYMIDDRVLRATKWIDEERQRQALVEENTRLQIPALLGVAVSGSTKGILVGQLAKILNQNGVETGEKRLFKWLRDNGYLIKSGRQRNCPTQKSRDLGVIDVRETMITHAHGAQPSFTPLITGKGQQYFVTKLVQLNLIQC